MKKTFFAIMLLIGTTAFSQNNKPAIVADLGGGYSSASHPFAEITAGLHKGSSYLFYNQIGHFTNLSNVPMIFSVDYGYTVNAWQPYGGASYQAGYKTGWYYSYGIRKYFRGFDATAGMSGRYFTIGLGVTSSNVFQKKKFKMKISAPVAISVIGVVKGMARGLHETLINHYARFKRVFPGANDAYWNPAISFKRKYKDFDGGDLRAAFPLSKSLLVAFTDPYHWTNAGQTLGWGATFYIGMTDLKGCNKRSLVKNALIDLGISLASDAIGFAGIHDGLFHK